MPIIAETHCHTCACSHAYSTIRENARAAANLGLKFLCITEHAPAIGDGPTELFFQNLPKTIPDQLEGVIVLKGAEVNIMDYEGGLDLPARRLEPLDWVIASYHSVCVTPGTIEDHTKGWLAIAKNPLVDVIGHCGNGKYLFDMERVFPAFAEYGKIVEINAHSFGTRPGSLENCREVAKYCKKYRVPVVCSSDAHFDLQVGCTQAAEELLQSVDFPEELILNNDYDRFLKVAREKSGRQLV